MHLNFRNHIHRFRNLFEINSFFRPKETIMSNQDNQVDMDDILDGTLDDLADLPEFKSYPPGVHRVTLVSFERDKDKKKAVMYVNFKGIETVELPSGSEDDPISDGQETRARYDLGNEYGQGAFKEILRSLATHYGAKTNRELMEEATGAEVLIVTSMKKDKKDATKSYFQVDSLEVV